MGVKRCRSEQQKRTGFEKIASISDGNNNRRGPSDVFGTLQCELDTSAHNR